MKVILMAVLMISTFGVAHSAENKMASAQGTNTTCTQESETAKCGNDKVGTGLLACLNEYKKSHKDFKISDSCEASLKQLHRDIGAKKN